MFDKIQSRSGGVAKQRVCDGMVQMEARSPVGQILGIKVWVYREPEAAELHKDRNGPVPLQVIHGQHNIDKVSTWFFYCSSILAMCFPSGGLFYEGNNRLQFSLTAKPRGQLTIGSWISVRSSRYEARGKFGEHERCVRVARGVAESNSSFLKVLYKLPACFISL